MRDRQKFRRFSEIRFTEYWGCGYGVGTFGIIEGSYRQVCGFNGPVNNYGIFILNKKGDKIINRVSWVTANQIKLSDYNLERANLLIERYLERNG